RRRGVDDVVPAVAPLGVRREPQQRRAVGPQRDDRVVVEIERALSVVGRRAAVAAVVADLPVAGRVRLDEDVAVDVGRAGAGGGADARAVLAVDEVELAVAALYPVVADDEARRAVLQVVASRARLERTEIVVLERDSDRRRVVIVLEDAAVV